MSLVLKEKCFCSSVSLFCKGSKPIEWFLCSFGDMVTFCIPAGLEHTLQTWRTFNLPWSSRMLGLQAGTTLLICISPAIIHMLAGSLYVFFRRDFLFRTLSLFKSDCLCPCGAGRICYIFRMQILYKMSSVICL